VFGGAARTAVLGIPHTVVAWYTWRDDRRTDAAAVLAGGLLPGWIAVEALVIDERSFPDPPAFWFAVNSLK
jgi:hypothetical protein